jgi:hypothetical protein
MKPCDRHRRLEERLDSNREISADFLVARSLNASELSTP